MSLMERVRAAGGEEGNLSAPETTSVSQELKDRLSTMLPPERLAKLAQENPKQAESEIRHACEAIFQESPWLADGYASPAILVQALVNDVFGLGPLEPYLEDESVTEIMINATKSFFIEREGKNIACPVPFTDEAAIRTLIDRILGPLGRRVDESSPMVDARLASGHRVNAVIPPISPDGPLVTIRKFARHVYSLSNLRTMGSFDANVEHMLQWAVAARKNIAVCGGTGTGKTTLLNALSCIISHSERIITIEDSAELRFQEHPHVVRLEARAQNAEGKGEITIRDLVKNALRMRPDRIIVGEVRGAEAIDMLSAMNTGHEGSLTTLHCNSPADAIMRLATMVRFAADLPQDVIEAQIGSALDLVVQISRSRSGLRYISQICEINFNFQNRNCEIIPIYEYSPAQQRGAWYACPTWVEAASAEGILSVEEVQLWLQSTSLLPPAA